MTVLPKVIEKRKKIYYIYETFNDEKIFRRAINYHKKMDNSRYAQIKWFSGGYLDKPRWTLYLDNFRGVLD